MGLSPEEALAQDHQRARDHAEEWITSTQNQITARGLILNGAIEEFNEFRNLPPSTNLGSAIWDFAFELLSKAIPALKLAEFIKKQHEIASIALKAAETFGRQAKRADKVVKHATGAAQILGKVADKLNDAKEIKEKGEKVFEENKALTQHASRKPIKDLIGELKQAQELWSNAIKVERIDWEHRLADEPASQFGSLEMNMQSTLKELPATFTESELDEIWTLYLYHMVGIWAGPMKNVKKVKTVDYHAIGRSSTTSWSVEGLNDTQQAQILEWFGPKAPRGKYYFIKPVKSIWDYLDGFPVQLNVSAVATKENLRVHTPRWR